MTNKLTLFKSFFFLIIFYLFNLTAAFAGANCIDNYNFRQRNLPHNISIEKLKTLQHLAESGNPAEGWRQLGLMGDAYASIAAKVLSPKPTFPNSFYKKLILIHWFNVNAPEVVQKNFWLVARQHFRQYIKILHSGYWPDSDQILMSYLFAIRSQGLPDATVFDAVWDASGLNNVQSWQVLNHLEEERTVFPSRACYEIGRSEAREILTKDFIYVPFKFINFAESAFQSRLQFSSANVR